jgi:hypothetical protein
MRGWSDVSLQRASNLRQGHLLLKTIRPKDIWPMPSIANMAMTSAVDFSTSLLLYRMCVLTKCLSVKWFWTKRRGAVGSFANPSFCWQALIRRKVDCSKHISLWKIHLNQTWVLVAGTKQSRQAKNRLGNLDCPVCLPSCSARLSCWFACFVLCLLLVHTFQRVFLQRPLTKLNKQGRWYMPLSSQLLNTSLWGDFIPKYSDKNDMVIL